VGFLTGGAVWGGGWGREGDAGETGFWGFSGFSLPSRGLCAAGDERGAHFLVVDLGLRLWCGLALADVVPMRLVSSGRDTRGLSDVVGCLDRESAHLRFGVSPYSRPLPQPSPSGGELGGAEDCLYRVQDLPSALRAWGLRWLGQIGLRRPGTAGAGAVAEAASVRKAVMLPGAGWGERLGGHGAAVVGGWPVVVGDAVVRHFVTGAGGSDGHGARGLAAAGR
jgi:hypothetical protein